MTVYNYTSDITETVSDYAIDGPGGGDIYNIATGVTIDGQVTGGAAIGEGDQINIDGTVRGAAYGVLAVPLSGENGNMTVHVGQGGTVFGLVGIYASTLSNQIVNDGTISSEYDSILSYGDDASIVNAGLVFSNQGSAISVYGTTSIVNRGTLTGKTYAIEGSDGRDTVANTGEIYGPCLLYGGDDTFVSTNGKLYGYVQGAGGADRIYGGTTSDDLFGGIGNDQLFGGRGNDWLYGGQGRDRLTGGIGADDFVFDTALGASNRDIVTDFSHAQRDHIQVENRVFRGLHTGRLSSAAFYAGTAAHDANDRFIYNAHTGALYYDRDGTGHAAQVLVATLSNHAALHASDFLVI